MTASTIHGLFVHRLGLTTLFALALCVAGCGDSTKGGNDTISGKVTLKGQAVSGQVVFITPDGKEHMAPIGEGGSYSVPGIPKGQVKITVRALPGATTTPKGSGDLPGMARGVAPPARYAKANNGLSFDSTGGNQAHNIELN
jgi:hypothetical protein